MQVLSRHDKPIISKKRKNFVSKFILYSFLAYLLFYFWHEHNKSSENKPTKRLFKKESWNKNGQTLDVKLLTETKFGSCEMHTVKSEDGKQVIDDWLWFDEYDQINVVAQLEGKDGKFFMFKQGKYGFEGESFSPIGGLINPGETAEEAAERELLEEAGLYSNKFINFGKYRISSTRGGGFLNVFLALDCKKSKDFKPSDDMEKQTVVYMTKDELLSAVLAQKFKEAKWTQTLAMSLLWLDNLVDKAVFKTGKKFYKTFQ